MKNKLSNLERTHIYIILKSMAILIILSLCLLLRILIMPTPYEKMYIVSQMDYLIECVITSIVLFFGGFCFSALAE